MKKTKIVNLFFILFPLLSAVAAIIWMVLIVPTFHYQVNILLIFLFVIIPLAIIIGGLFTAWKSFKALRKGKGLLSKKQLLPSVGYSFILLESLFSIAIAGIIVAALFNDRPPQFFPFDDQEAAYTVEKKDNWFYVVYDSPSNKNSSYSCSVGKDQKELCHTDILHHFEAVVGKSLVDLEPLLDKSVKLDGEFVNGKQQCIVNKCIDIGNYAVLNISSIQIRR